MAPYECHVDLAQQWLDAFLACFLTRPYSTCPAVIPLFCLPTQRPHNSWTQPAFDPPFLYRDREWVGRCYRVQCVPACCR